MANSQRAPRDREDIVERREPTTEGMIISLRTQGGLVEVMKDPCTFFQYLFLLLPRERRCRIRLLLNSNATIRGPTNGHEVDRNSPVSHCLGLTGSQKQKE
jgi:hypothetical protein